MYKHEVFQAETPDEASKIAEFLNERYPEKRNGARIYAEGCGVWHECNHEECSLPQRQRSAVKAASEMYRLIHRAR